MATSDTIRRPFDILPFHRFIECFGWIHFEGDLHEELSPSEINEIFTAKSSAVHHDGVLRRTKAIVYSRCRVLDDLRVNHVSECDSKEW